MTTLRFDGKKATYENIKDMVISYIQECGEKVFITPDNDHGKRSGGDTLEVSDMVVVIRNPKKPTKKEFKKLVGSVGSKFIKLDKIYIYNKYNIPKVIEVLKNKLETRRAVFTMFTTDQINNYVHCVIGGQFLVRDGKISLRVFMRSNDAYNAFIGNVMEFTYALHCIAEELGLEVDKYIHYATSMHIYEIDLGE